MPRTAATVGTRPYFSRCDACWNLATTASISSHRPALIAGSMAARLAPSENGSFVCQMTSPAQSRSASSTARSTPSSTSSPIACCLLLNDTIATSSPRCHIRTASVSKIVVPVAAFRRAPGRGSAAGDRRAATSAGGTRCPAPPYAPGRRVHAGGRRARAAPRPAAARSPAPCRPRCPPPSSRRPPSSPPPATARTAPSTSRSPSAARGRRRARCRRSRRDGRRSSGTGRGRSPTGTAPADAGARAAWRASRRAA